MKKSPRPAPPPTADKAVCTSPIFSVGATSKRPAMSPPAARATPKRHAVTAASKQLDVNNNDVGENDGFELANHRRHRQRNQTATTSVSVHARQPPKQRLAQRRVHHRPDAIVIKANDASSYANILRTSSRTRRCSNQSGAAFKTSDAALRVPWCCSSKKREKCLQPRRGIGQRLRGHGHSQRPTAYYHDQDQGSR
ncbi:unnamed protein product [Trichogramma brassicae]|uniref:Uncharacterized protein n=1 Tax=Trichogramma brassicae TaxID=86971 RepID=A0A6H5INC6_9HYME|nr:unnamed protein product [Trichogramma brassicae]